MAIKRGVSLYSYQQEEWFGRMTWREMLKEVATNLDGATGIEIISEATIPHFPFPGEEFYQEWLFEMARWGLEAVTMDVFPDPLQFRRDHVMNDREQAERLKMELRIANKMGFKNLRILGTPISVVELALPLAEELDVRINQEIHAPATIRRPENIDDSNPYARANAGKIMDIAEYIQKTGTRHYGLHPDFGIFKKEPPKVYMDYYFRCAGEEHWEEESKETIERFRKCKTQNDEDELKEWAKKTYPKVFNNPANPFALEELNHSFVPPEDLKLIAPYIYVCHGKFMEMTEIEGMPGEYEDKAIDYDGAIAVLKEIGFEGYIDSEYEGQRNQQDRGLEFLPNEIEEVRRHHKMLKRLIGE
ncbi:MAG: hypothetical protein IKE00_04015 [Oscillospiraceae bacterium]|nr:hypothetical protein [Oscillospiraceae bacterium]